MNTIKVKIKEQEFIAKASFRASLEVERLNKKLGEPAGELENMTRFLYAALVANNRTEPAFIYTLEEFIDLIDENPEILSSVANMTNDAPDEEPETSPATKKGKK